MTAAPAILFFLLVAQTSLASPVKITEVAYDVVGSEPDGEWVELKNTGAVTVSLADLRLADEETLGGSEAVLAFPPDAVLDPGQVIVVAVNAVAFEAALGFAPDFDIKGTSSSVPQLTPDRTLGGTQFQLANSMDEVLLLDAAGLLLDGVSWGRSPPLPGIVNTPLAREGQTISRDLDEATGAFRPWTVGAPTAGTLRLIPSPSQNQTPPAPEPVDPEPTPEEPAPPPEEEPAPTPEEPAPTPEEPTPEEPAPTPEAPDEGEPAPRDDGPVATDDGGGVDLDRSDRFDGPILPETSGGCAATTPASTTLACLLLLLLRRRRP